MKRLLRFLNRWLERSTHPKLPPNGHPLAARCRDPRGCRYCDAG